MLKQTNIERSRLTSVLAENLRDHTELYDLALSSWKENYAKYVSEFYKKVKAGDYNASFAPPVKPTSYAKNYEQVIKQLEYSSDEIINLSSTEFQNYVLDEWTFSFHFYQTASAIHCKK